MNENANARNKIAIAAMMIGNKLTRIWTYLHKTIEWLFKF